MTKKFNFQKYDFWFYSFFVISLLFSGCQVSEEPEVPDPNRVINVLDNGKTGGTYLLMAQMGHDGSTCSGCVLRDGQKVHVNCQGPGNLCGSTASVTLQQVGSAITATTTDTFGLTSEDFFNMPARSLSTGESGNNAYLNIPAQLVERDTATLQFTFTGLFYTGKPAYDNN